MGVTDERLIQAIKTMRALRKALDPLISAQTTQALEDAVTALEELEQIRNAEHHPDEFADLANEAEERQMRQMPIAQSDMDIEELHLTVRPYNCLKRRGLNTVGEVIDFVQQGSPKWYRRVRNLGVKSADEVARKVFQVTGIQINTWETGAIIYGGCIDDQAGGA